MQCSLVASIICIACEGKTYEWKVLISGGHGVLVVECINIHHDASCSSCFKFQLQLNILKDDRAHKTILMPLICELGLLLFLKMHL